MEQIKVFLLICGVLQETCLSSGASVFLSGEFASSVLTRNRRHNTGALEEMMRDNLERECLEEKCTLEEAREVFENEEKTMEFWLRYVDGDQCLSSPCQNGGTCEDGMSSYVCWCRIGFNGKNCELEMARQCDVNNGGCMQFCIMDKIYRAVCDCADGYRLGLDSRSCEPTDKFPCGRLSSEVADILASRSLISSGTVQNTHAVEHHNTSENQAEPRSTEPSRAQPNRTEFVLNSTTSRPSAEPHWAFYPTLPTITAQKNEEKRIVGGNEATPGEIPWQVALVSKETKVVFCGGSLISDVWVVTAAHCLFEGKIGHFFVRVGEHNVITEEGTESDHEVSEHIPYPKYNIHRGHNHDIALLRLRPPVNFSRNAVPVCLGAKQFTDSLLKSASTSLVSGWGRLRYGGREATSLQRLEVPYVDRTECKGSDKVSRFMFCAGFKSEKKDTCQGDSGGPHVTRFQDTWFLTGITSWGEECAKEGQYGIYTLVSRYINWISNITGIRAGK